MSQLYSELPDGTMKVRTCAWSPPGDHPVGCGMFLTIKDGKVVKVEGDADHPVTNGRLCIRCLSLPEVMYNEQRIIYPMKRAKEDRGKDKWERITWDEALDMVEEKYNHIVEEFGVESILVFQGTGRESTLYASPLAYACFRTPNEVLPLSGESCYGPRCVIADTILGAGYPEIDYAQFFEDRYDDPRYELPEYVVLWGKDPLHSNPDGFFGHSLIDLMKRGVRFITVDPRATWMATRSEYHLQLRPCSDAALALGMINVIISEDLYDHEFVGKWCFGFDDLKERAAEYPLDRVEEITWVPKETIIAAARAYANASSASILWGLAIDTNKNGVQAGQGILSLIALTGNYDVPGGNLLAKPSSFMGKWRYECIKYVSPEAMEKRIIKLPEYIGFANTIGSVHPDMVLDTLETEKPYPFKMMWSCGSNVFASGSGAQGSRWYEGLKKLDFNVIQDLFMTPLAMGCCDLFLPLATFAEHEGIVLPHFGRNTHMLGAMNTAVDPGETKSDLEICFLIGKRLNPEAWPWETVAEFFTEQIKTEVDMTFEELKEAGWKQFTDFQYRKYEKGLLRSDGKPGFNTTTGLVEFKSTLYPQWGEDALPYFEENDYTQLSHPELAEEYPLIMNSGSREPTSFHTEHRQIPTLRAIRPDAIVEINPITAKKYGIAEGDWVAIENPLGRAVEKAHITPICQEKVIHATHGWWYPEQCAEEPNLLGVWKSNINSLVPHFAVGKLGFGAPYKNVLCKIYKVDSLDD